MIPLSWFEERRGMTVKRIRHDVHTNKEHTSYVSLKDDKIIKYHFDLQSNQNKYEDNRQKPYANDKRRKARRSGGRFNRL